MDSDIFFVPETHKALLQQVQSWVTHDSAVEGVPFFCSESVSRDCFILLGIEDTFLLVGLCLKSGYVVDYQHGF